MRSLWASDPRDGLLVAATALHASGLVVLSSTGIAPAAVAAFLVGAGLWWTSNTVAHIHIHRPLFRAPALNAAFSTFLTLLLGYPHSYWRARHLRHHAGAPERPPFTRGMAFETGLVLASWSAAGTVAPAALLRVMLPGWIFGQVLCLVQGRYEHRAVGPGGKSFYGPLYNLLLFRDGYHAEHHRDPARHWTRLRRGNHPASRWPPLLRWIEELVPAVLGLLERLTLRLPALQRFMLRTHERALRALLRNAGPIRRVAIVGGGLFPRTALILGRLLPRSRITIIDQSPGSLRRARELVDAHGIAATYEPGRGNFDLVVLPLSYEGDRCAIYDLPPAPWVLVHDWIWRRSPRSRVVSWLLLKRINLVGTHPAVSGAGASGRSVSSSSCLPQSS
jgi:hypothetical protein